MAHHRIQHNPRLSPAEEKLEALPVCYRGLHCIRQFKIKGRTNVTLGICCSWLNDIHIFKKHYKLGKK